MKFTLCVLATIACASADTFELLQDKQVVTPGASVIIRVHPVNGSAIGAARWNVSPKIDGVEETHDDSSFTYTAPISRLNPCLPVRVTATMNAGTKQEESHSVYFALTTADRVSIQEPCPGSNIVMSVIGFEQAGGASAKGDQKFFFDIFDSRPLPGLKGKADDIFGPPWRWWGSVRIASYPQQITTPVSQFASGFATQVGNLPVNQLAAFGEFRAGIEKRIASFRQLFLAVPATTSERTSLGVVAYFGGLADLNPPEQRVAVLEIPPPATPQRFAFDTVFPSKQYPILSVSGTKYIGLTTPDHNSFYWQYAAGFRLTTRYFDPDGTLLSAPAMFSATFGQNELVTGGHRRGIVGTFEGFYPLPLGPRGKNASLFYLFGRADLRLGRANVGRATAVPLAPALDAATNSPVSATNPGVAVIAIPSNRDLYSIGVGIDAVQVINAIGTKLKDKSGAQAVK